jgi:hypothetical protein
MGQGPSAAIRAQCPIASATNDGLMSQAQAATVSGIPVAGSYPNPSVTADAVSAGAVAIDGSIKNTLHQVALSANATLSIANPVTGETYQFKIVNAGAFALTWPATFKWPGGTPPVITSSGTDYVTASWNGTSYFATCSQAFA